ncbi:MAG: hypothetical protein NVS1B4_03630 [Gemmatimonadaceae bacterium]
MERATSAADGSPDGDSGGRAYSTADFAAYGRVAGGVELVGDVPRDTTITPTTDEDVCGAAFAEAVVDHDHATLGDAIVWLIGIHGGKRPPIERKMELTNNDCHLEPRVQAALAGTTLNVRSEDRVTHRNRFLRVGSGALLALVTETDDGMVIPVERVLAQSGTVEVRCDQHPWTRAWIAAFDHPYYAVTEPVGAFAMDSVPPGRYAIAAWHPRLGRVIDSVTVEAGKETRLTLRLRGR